MVKFFALTLLCAATLFAKEPFSSDKIAEYLTKENPYIYASYAKEQLYRGKLEASQGVYDTTLFSKYEKKSYPKSEANYLDAGVSKAFEFGADLSLAYRKAKGTQEYNNIKTDEDGELLLALKLPLVSLIEQMDRRRLNKGVALKDVELNYLQFQERLRSLYFEIMQSYNRLLYNNALYTLDLELLKKVEKRKRFLAKRVENGSIAPSDLLEASKQELQAKQNSLTSYNSYIKSLRDFLKFFKLSTEEFNTRFSLEVLSFHQIELPSFEKALQTAIENRADLMEFKTEIEKEQLKKKENQLLKYPTTDLTLYGVQDQSDTGFKVALNLNFPIERRQYEGNALVMQQNISILNAYKDQKMILLKTHLQNILGEYGVLTTNIASAKEELTLNQQLLTLEEKRYNHGSSTLFQVNQREIELLQSQKKLFHYYLQSRTLEESYFREIAQHPLHEIVKNNLL